MLNKAPLSTKYVLHWDLGNTYFFYSHSHSTKPSSRMISWKTEIPSLDHFFAEHPWRRASFLSPWLKFHQIDFFPHRRPDFSIGFLLLQKCLTNFQAFQRLLKTLDPWTTRGASTERQSVKQKFFHPLGLLQWDLLRLFLINTFHGSSPSPTLAIHLIAKDTPWNLRSLRPKPPHALLLVH